MLINLHVTNFALIEEAEIDFTPGLNILTGETGAGKSILIDAVSAALGLRTGPEVIRRGADHAYVELVFSVPEEDRKEKLREMDISTEYDCIVVSRKSRPGRSIHRINDETVTSQTVRRATELLLDIHGQHEHQSLLKPSAQRRFLDQFAGPACLELKKRTAAAYEKREAAAERLASFRMPPDERLRRVDFLEYEIVEIRDAAVKAGEEEELTESFRTMSHAERIRSALAEVTYSLSDETDAGAGSALTRAIRSLSPVSSLSPSLTSLQEELLNLEELLQDAARDADACLEESDFSPEELKKTEDRLDLIHHLESKYGRSADDLGRVLEEKEKELSELEHYEESYREAEEEYHVAEEALLSLCEELSRMRTEAAPRLAEAIRQALSELNFLSVEFRIEVRPGKEPTSEGYDEAEFLISLNPGQPLDPLRKVASGGELSRIMLALKTVLADRDEIPTVIFDEIDAGISGRTAQMVGRKLKEIAASRQVILITHLPQIAAMADTHIGIEKTAEGNTTRTKIHILNEEESLGELARLLGGMNLSENIWAAARELKGTD